MAEESCVTDGQDSFFIYNSDGRELSGVWTALSASAAKQIISKYHTTAYNQKTDEIAWNNPHQKHTDSDAEQRITDQFFHL